MKKLVSCRLAWLSFAAPFSLALIPHAAAQTTALATLPEVVVTANPLGATQLTAPVNALSGLNLLLRREGTLGETLSGTPGVASTYFGPNASRPIIRGQDGDRIRILSNGGGTLDASGLSYDHAVPTDMLSVERVEVLRGPGALLYGGAAVGGVVNLLDSRIARKALFGKEGGVGGKFELGVSSADSGQNGAAMLQTGTDKYALHVDLFTRSSADVAAPVDLACAKTGAPALAARICNSAAKSQGAAVGGSLLFDRGYVGASFSGYGSVYGTVAEDEVTIDMRQRRTAVEGELRAISGLGGFVTAVKAQYSHSDYTHTELDAGAPGTVFATKGHDWRLEAKHASFKTLGGQLQGVWGLQGDSSQFSADGAEAFAPYSKSNSTALFILEELSQPWGKLSLGARAESARVRSEGHPTLAKFAADQKSFSLGSYALGGVWNLNPAWQLSANLNHSQRAPKDYELYADGPHIATAAYEVGNASLAKEKSTNIDLGVAWKQGAHRFALSGFVSRFSNYIFADQTAGMTRNASDGELNPTDDPANPGTSLLGSPFEPQPEFRYQQVQARFYGIEASGKLRLMEAGQTLDLELRGDLVRADNLSAAQPLPRIAPVRLGASLVWAQAGWGARLGFDHWAAQNRVAPGQAASGAYTLWNAVVTYRMAAAALKGTQLTWYARLDNAGNRLAYSASSILTQTAPGKAPLPGRSLKVGLQAAF